MTTLLIKDWRLNAPATLCLVLIYAVLPFIVFFSRAVDEGVAHALNAESMTTCFMISAFAGLGISMLIIPAFGGIAFARERRDRSADFLASLSIDRTSVDLVTIGDDHRKSASARPTDGGEEVFFAH